MHILGLDNVDDVVNGIGEYFLIFLVWPAMRFLTPPFHLNLVIPAVANNINLQQRLRLIQLFNQMRGRIFNVNWGHANAQNLEKAIIRNAKRLIPDLMEYFRYLRTILVNHGSNAFIALSPNPSSAVTTNPCMFFLM